MVVWRKHGKEPSALDLEHILHELGGAAAQHLTVEHYTDNNTRTTPQHATRTPAEKTTDPPHPARVGAHAPAPVDRRRRRHDAFRRQARRRRAGPMKKKLAVLLLGAVLAASPVGAGASPK